MDDARFSRQLALPGFTRDAQQRLADARVLVIGAGGLGSAVIPALAAAGVGVIGIVDNDIVETSNLHRQFIHGVADIGTGKVISATSSIAAISPTTVVESFVERLTAENAERVFARYDLVLDGSDNFPTRYLANDAAALVGIPLVWGAVSQYAGQVGIAWATRGPHYRDLFPSPPPPGTVLSCETGGVFPTVVGVIGAIMAGEAIKIITGLGEPLIGRVTTFDALSGTFREIRYDRDPTAVPIDELVDYELFCGLPARSDTLTALELSALVSTVTLVDVREPWETALASIPGSRRMEPDDIDDAPDLVVYCHHGVRSAVALQKLAARGIHARHLDGGIDAWSRLVDPTVPRY